MEKMTLHRALSELKLIDARIEKQLTELAPNGVVQKGKLVNGITPEEEFVLKAKAKFQSIQDLIARKHKLKMAIVEANGKTRVKINETEMTIADAITYKSILEYKKKLIKELKDKFGAARLELEKKNLLVEQNLQKVLEATFGKDNVKISKEDVEMVRKPFLDANEWRLVDPLKSEETVEKLETEVNNFLSEVDAVLSEINAVTFIEI